MTSKPIVVSVIVTTKNEAKNIETVLESIKNQSYPHVEMVVVDNNSTDQTKALAKKYTDKVFNKGPERSTQRNYAVEKASGDYVLVLDADMRLEPNVIKECVELANNGTDAAIIPEESYGKGFWATCKWVERHCYIGDETIEAARFFKRELYLELGGFDHTLISGEDWDLTARTREKGIKIGRCESLVWHNEGPLRLGTTMKKKYYYGQKISSYVKKNKSRFKKQARFFRPCFFRNWKFLAKQHLFTFGMFFMKAMEFGAGGMGLLQSKFQRVRSD